MSCRAGILGMHPAPNVQVLLLFKYNPALRVRANLLFLELLINYGPKWDNKHHNSHNLIIGACQSVVHWKSNFNDIAYRLRCEKIIVAQPRFTPVEGCPPCAQVKSPKKK